MIANIIDNRKRRFRWKKVNAVVEATCHDNATDDADEALHHPDSPVYDSRLAISVADALAWANEMSGAVTLFLYDLDANI